MIHIFYVLVILCILFEIGTITMQVDFHKAFEDYRLTRKELGRMPAFDEMNDTVTGYSLLSLPYWFILFVGLLSSQWVAFALIILLAFIPKRKLWFRYVNSILIIAILTFIVLNKYQLHIDLSTLIFK